jgi:hypothetical protein
MNKLGARRVECRRCTEDKSTHDAGLRDQARTKPCITHGKQKEKRADAQEQAAMDAANLHHRNRGRHGDTGDTQ